VTDLQFAAMKVLIMTAMYPVPENPAFGSFVRTQAESLRRAGVTVEVLVLQGRFRKLIYPRGMFQLRQRLEGGGFDLVHAHYSYVGMVARTQGDLPVVVTYHGDDLLGTVDERGHTTATSRLIAAAGRKLAQYVDACIVQTQQMSDTIPKGNVFVIPHEVDFETFKPSDLQHARAMLGLANHKKYLLFAANPKIPVKHFPLAQAVAKELNRCDPTVELLVVYKETQERLALYMSACDVLVFPSYQEGSPNIVKQAMACNLPIVATDVGDVRQVIGDCRGCYVCSPRIDEFAARISQILLTCNRTDGREHVHHLDASTVSRRVIAVYENVMRNRPQRLRSRMESDSVVSFKQPQ
jgi:glycosyltransferase involved in cell wall biosynthesis